ncbi:MAG: hypothetical protein ACLTKT_08150 [Clostridia bacterium]
MKCKYCDKEIKGYIETSKLDPKIKLCRNCYYTEMIAIAMSKIIKETEEGEIKR